MSNFKRKIQRLKNKLYKGNPYYDQEVIKSIEERKKANKRAIELVKQNKSEYTDEEKKELARYTGQGALGVDDEDEFYTPKEVAKSLFNMIDLQGGETILEPASGTGVIIGQAPKDVNFIGCELNKISGKIADILNDNADIQAGVSFEEYSKNIPENSVDCIVSNVPFSNRKDAFRQIDEKYEHITRSEDYFILKSLDLLKPTKQANFLTTSSTIQRKSKRLIREEILTKASFLGGYRLPSEMFKDTGTEQVVDILVFEKHPIKILNLIENGNTDISDKIKENELNKQFLEGTYFTNNPKQIFGKFTSKEELKAEAEKKKIKLHHLAQKDIVELPKGMTLDDVKQELLKTKPFKNTTNYKWIIESSLGIKLDNVNSLNEYSEELVAYDTIFNEILAVKNSNKLPKLMEYSVFLDNWGKLASKHKNNTLFREYYNLRKFANLYDVLEPLILYFYYQDPTNYKQEYLIENKDKITLLLNTYEKKLKEAKIKGKVKNNIIRCMDLLQNFDLETGKYRDTYEELEEYVELESKHPLAKKIDTLSETEKNEKVGYDNGIMSVDKSLYTKEELNKSNEIVAIGNKVFSIEDYVNNNLPNNYNEVLEFIENLEADKSEKQKLLKLVNERKQTLTYDDIIVDINNIRFYVDNSTLYSIYRKLTNDKVLRNALLDIMKEDIKSEHKEINANTILEILKSDWLGSYLNRAMLDGGGSYFESINGVANIRERYFNNGYADKMNEEEAYDYLKNIVKDVLSKNVDLINASLKEILNENEEYINIINETLEKKSTIVKEVNPQGSEEPLNELSSFVNPKILNMARHYQNSDARYFGSNLQGTIAQDTGLGKSITMILGALYAIKSKSAKRVLIVTPNAVYKKFIENEVPKVLKKDFIKNNLLTFNSEDILNGVRELKTNKKIKMVIMPEPTFGMIGLKEDTINYLYGYDKSNSDENLYPFALSKTGVDKWKADGVKTYMEDLGIDALFLDEAHFYKNSMSVMNKVKGLGGISSKRGLGTLYKAEYIRMKRGNRKGVVAVTATPTTSSPQEIFAMMLLNGSLEKPIHKNDFIKYFCDIREVSSETITGKMKTKHILKGIKNLKELRQLGWDKVIYRNAETEQDKAKAMGKEINVKPPYDEITVNIPSSNEEVELDTLRETFSKHLELVNKIKRNEVNPLKIDEVEFDFIKKYGEVFGFFNRAKLVSVSPDFSLEVTKVKLNDNFTYEKLEKALEKVTFVYKQSKAVKATIGFDVKTIEHKFNIFDWYQSDFYLFRKNNGLAKEMLEDKNGETYLNIPTKDYKEIKKFMNALKKAKLIDIDSVFELGSFQKFGALIENMDKEFSRHPLSKQIIYATTLNSHLVLKSLFSEKYPDSNVFLFNGVEASGDDKILEIQNQFNESKNPDILIFNQKGQVGVDFNKNVSSVHLLDIPDTPDQWHQAMGRAVRQGNEIDKVNVYKYIKLGTFDEFMIDLVSNKSNWIEALKDENLNNSNIDNSTIEEIYSKAIMYYSDKDWDDATKIKKYQEMLEAKAKLKESKLKEISFNKNMDRFEKIVSDYLIIKENETSYYYVATKILNLPTSGYIYNYYSYFSKFEKGLEDLAYKKGFTAYTKILQEINIFKKTLYKNNMIGFVKVKLYDFIQGIRPNNITEMFEIIKSEETKNKILNIISDSYKETFNETIENINKELSNIYKDKIPATIKSNFDKALEVAFKDYGSFEKWVEFNVNDIISKIKAQVSRLENLPKIIENYQDDLIKNITDNLIIGNGHKELVIAKYIEDMVNKSRVKRVVKVGNQFLDIYENTFIAKYGSKTIVSVKGSLKAFYEYGNSFYDVDIHNGDISQIKILSSQDVNEMYNENNEDFIALYEYALKHTEEN